MKASSPPNRLSLPEGAAAFIIGLRRTAAERGIPTQKAWQKAGLDTQWWEAVDGAQRMELRPGEAARSFLLRGLRATQQPKSIVSEASCTLGCYLSHYRLWQHCLEKGYRRVLIVEDDVVPRPSLSEIQDALWVLDDSFELIKLHYFRLPEHLQGGTSGKEGHALRRFQHSTGEVHLHRPLQTSDSTAAYLVNRNALLKLVKYAMPASMPIDFYMDSFVIHRTRIYLSVGAQARVHCPGSSIRVGKLPAGKRANFFVRNYARLISKFRLISHDMKLAWIVLSSPIGEFHPRKRIPPEFPAHLSKSLRRFFTLR